MRKEAHNDPGVQKPVRRLRFKLPSLEKWVILGVMIGVVSGLAGVVLSKAISLISEYAFAKYTGIDLNTGQIVSISILTPFIVALGGLLSGILTYRFAPEAEGHGTDAVIEALHWRAAVIKPRVPLVKLTASSILIGLGGSAGKEGPIALIGAGFGSALSEKLHLTSAERRMMVLAGMAGGISAVFKAPLGAMLFALEVPYKRDMEIEAVLPLGVSSIVAYVISISLTGVEPLFTLPGVKVSTTVSGISYYALLGIILGLTARLYVRVFYTVRDIFKKLSVNPMVKPAIGGLVTGAIGMMLPQVLGQGYPFLQQAMYGKVAWTVMLAAALGKILANSFSVASGGSGGVFAPSLFIGGMMGGALAKLYTNDPSIIAASTVVGMAAFFAGAGKVPFTSIVIVAEMTRGYELIVPSIIAVTLSYVIAGQETIYEKQVDTRTDSPFFLKELGEKLLRQIKVKEIMTREVVTVKPNWTLRRVIELIAKTHHMGFPVVEDSRVVGIITQSDVLRVRFEELDKVRVRDVMSKNVVAVLPHDSLEEALRKMLRYGIGRLPVVESYETMKLVGIVTKKDIVKAYEELRFLM